jgi:hypothetical protein
MQELKKKDVVYFARIIPSSYMYDVCELIIRTVEDNWFVGIDKRDKHAFLFYDTDINKIIFTDRKKALEKVKDAESKRRKVENIEIDYEEY